MIDRKKGFNRSRRKFTTSLLLASTTVSACNRSLKKETDSPEFKTNKPGYVVLESPVPQASVNRESEQSESNFSLELMHFCGFFCNPCYKFDPLIDRWIDDNSSVVMHLREAPPLNPSWETSSRLYYALELHKVIDKHYSTVFTWAQENQDWMRSDRIIASRIGSLEPSIDESKFLDTLQSFGVKAKMKRANYLAHKARIQTIPSVVIKGNGQYMTSPAIAGGHKQMIVVLDRLLAIELAQSQTKT